MSRRVYQARAFPAPIAPLPESDFAFITSFHLQRADGTLEPEALESFAQGRQRAVAGVHVAIAGIDVTGRTVHSLVKLNQPDRIEA